MLKVDFLNKIKGELKFNEPLAKYTTFKIGGPAQFLVEPCNLEELALLIKELRKSKLPVLIIGAGSNILVSDRGKKAVVIRLSAAFFKKIKSYNQGLEVGAGTLLSTLVSTALKSKLSGVEFLAGIPATVGGALIMNAGALGGSIGDLVEAVKVLDYKGNVKVLNKTKLKFSYRKSNLSKYIVLSVKLKLEKKTKKEIKKRIEECLDHRKSTHDYSGLNAGCIFKNPKKRSAGELIDLCGLKGRRIGDAQISSKHANFIINRSRAKASDVQKLIKCIKSKVRHKFNINLEPEIKIW